MEELSEAQSEFLEDVMKAFAKYDSKVRSERVKRGLQRRKERLQGGSKISDGLLHHSELRATI